MSKYSALIPLKLKEQIAQAICHPIIGNFLSWFFHDRIPSQGLTIDTNTPLVSCSAKAAIFWGLYERSEIRFIKQYLRRDLDVIELGSSLGVGSCCIRRKLLNSAKLICVEANPELIFYIQQNLKLNGLSGGVTVLNEAIDYSSQPFILLELWSQHLWSRIINENQKNRSTISVKATTLLEILDKHEVEQYVLVCDIEGSEIGMITYDREALRRCRQIIIELHGPEVTNKDIHIHQLQEKLITIHGFALTAQHGPVCVLEKTISTLT